MRNVILEDYLHVELNMLDELILSGKAWEDTEHSKKEYARKEAPKPHRSGDWSSRLKDQSKPFSRMRVFLCPKANPQGRNNYREYDHL